VQAAGSPVTGEPPRELFGHHPAWRAPRWLLWTSGAVAVVGLGALLLGPSEGTLAGALLGRLPFQLGLVGLLVCAGGRASATLDERGVRCRSVVREDSMTWAELAAVQPVGRRGAVLRAADGRTIRVRPLPVGVARALQDAVRRSP